MQNKSMHENYNDMKKILENFRLLMANIADEDAKFEQFSKDHHTDMKSVRDPLNNIMQKSSERLNQLLNAVTEAYNATKKDQMITMVMYS